MSYSRCFQAQIFIIESQSLRKVHHLFAVVFELWMWLLEEFFSNTDARQNETNTSTAFLNDTFPPFPHSLSQFSLPPSDPSAVPSRFLHQRPESSSLTQTAVQHWFLVCGVKWSQTALIIALMAEAVQNVLLFWCQGLFSLIWIIGTQCFINCVFF